MSDLLWLNDAQWARLQPLLPTDVRGVPRVDDRRVISGIIHVLRSGCRWVDAPPSYGLRKTLHNRFVRWTMRSIWRRIFEALAATGGPARRGAPRQQAREGPPLLRRGKRGAQNQAIGRSRGGRTTKLHAISDGLGRPIRFLLTGGQAADCRSAEALLAGLPSRTLVMADRAYDTDAIRRQIEGQGAVPNIPPKATRRWKSCFSPVLYRARNAVERMFCRLKDYRRIATRYDKLADNFLAAVYIVASVTCGL